MGNSTGPVWGLLFILFVLGTFGLFAFMEKRRDQEDKIKVQIAELCPECPTWGLGKERLENFLVYLRKEHGK